MPPSSGVVILHKTPDLSFRAKRGICFWSLSLLVILDIFNRGPRILVFSCGVSPPHDEVLLFRQKDPKPFAPGRGPAGAFTPVPFAWAAELASLRQSSPPNRVCGTGAQPRPQAPDQPVARYADAAFPCRWINVCSTLPVRVDSVRFPDPASSCRKALMSSNVSRSRSGSSNPTTSPARSAPARL